MEESPGSADVLAVRQQPKHFPKAVVMPNCPNCRSNDVVGFTLSPAGQALRFTHCRDCEHRWWIGREEAAALRLPDVLATLSAA